MRKINISVSFDDEKLSALKIYLTQKEQTVENELEKYLETLFRKTVPMDVQKFFAMKSGEEIPAAEPKRSYSRKTNPQTDGSRSTDPQSE